MNYTITFATPVGMFDASEFVEYGESLFDGRVKILPIGSDKSLTSLQGYNTEGSICQPLPNDKPLKDFIVKSAKEFSTLMGYDTEAYEFEVPNIWINELRTGGSHHLHSHYGYSFSGCFYTKLPTNADAITFNSLLHRVDKWVPRIKEYTMFNSPHWTLNPKEGDLYIWESYMQHQIPHREFEGVRHSIAFDIKLTLKASHARFTNQA
jgi:uncharacterized protein (TIGR02466 family)